MTMTSFKALMKQSLQEIKESEKELLQHRPYFNKLKPSEFGQLFAAESKKALLKRKRNQDPVLDSSNKHIINQLYFYLKGDSRFEGDLTRGILLLGPLGTGKTIIMEAFCGVFNKISARKRITIIKAKELWPTIKRNEEGFYPLKQKPLYIDDMGKEPKKIIDFGTETCPMAELLSLRYDYGALTFATGNYNLNTLSQHYGETITDRMKEMFNILILTGNSRRK